MGLWVPKGRDPELERSLSTEGSGSNKCLRDGILRLCHSWYEDSLLVPGLMAGQPSEAEPVPLCLAPGHILSIIQDRPPVQPSPNQTCSLSRPLWFPRGRFQALLSPGLLPPCSCVLPPPLSPSSRPACPRCCLCGVGDTVTGGLDGESRFRNCPLALLVEHLQVQLWASFCLCIQDRLPCSFPHSSLLASYKFPGTNMSRSGGTVTTSKFRARRLCLHWTWFVSLRGNHFPLLVLSQCREASSSYFLLRKTVSLMAGVWVC